MKLFEITSEFDDDPSLIPEHKQKQNQAIAYMWKTLYNRFLHAKSKELFYRYKEPLIKHKDLWVNRPDCAYKFARFIIRSRWPEGEPAIARSSRWACEYAIHVLNDRFPAGEPAIRNDPQYYDKYKRKFGKIRFASDPQPKSK